MELQSGAAKLANADRLPLPCKLLQHLREFSQGHPVQAAFGVNQGLPVLQPRDKSRGQVDDLNVPRRVHRPVPL